VLAGLSLPQKRISPRYFFDEGGAQLYAALCEQPERYLMQAEAGILRDNLAAVVQFVGPETELIELRTGIGVQTAFLLERLQPLVYVPIDIDGRMLEAASRELAELFPWLNISGMRADLDGSLALPEFAGLPIRRKAVLLWNSVIGGYAPEEALAVLSNARQLAGAGGVLLAGVDLKKDPATIVSAYSDALGMNAALHLNLLSRINRELGGDFQPRRFAYRASYDDRRGRVEMRLESLYSQFARVGGRRFDFAPNETVDTGVAYAYSIAEFQALARRAGFAEQMTWTDAAQMFAIHGMIAV
jgi:dimethylhistidine N-methyltransferase